MQFTDDDLKRLEKEKVIQGWGAMQSLIARLKAAEVLVKRHQYYPEGHPLHDPALEAWRKASGK